MRTKASMCEEECWLLNTVQRGHGQRLFFSPGTSTNLEANHGLAGSYEPCDVCTNCRLLGELVSLGQLPWAQ